MVESVGMAMDKVGHTMKAASLRQIITRALRQIMVSTRAVDLFRLQVEDR